MSTMTDSAIAVIGLSGRYPGARDVHELWNNLLAGRESVRRLDANEMEAAGIAADPTWVPMVAEIEDAECFDAEFFGKSPREARLTDPQHRVFLECAWNALEDAGYAPDATPGRVGVFAGSSLDTYLLTSPRLLRTLLEDPATALQGNDKDFLATRVSYLLGLRGPSLTIQTACSTSLVATHLAMQSLLVGESDMALAGGVSLRFPRSVGYRYQEGGILSPDGHCRAFDARGQGTIGGEGVGIVVLKRLDRALEDNDHVRAVLLGSAVNNDGAGKVGYMAPSVEGQREVIEEALAVAEVGAETIGLVEAHGTGTPIGDPIEVAALTQAFRATTKRKAFCALGSVKSNIGHLDAAAGIASLTKAVMALENRAIPPTLHFEHPNPAIRFDETPFHVNTTAKAWARENHPRRAAVSSFGVGGTNAHVIAEEAPERRDVPRRPRRQHVIPFSARTPEGLDRLLANWARDLDSRLHIADIAFTAACGRTHHPCRAVAVVETTDGLARALATGLRRGQAPTRARRAGLRYGNEGPLVLTDLLAEEPSLVDEIDRAGVSCGRTARDLAAATDRQALDVRQGALAKLWKQWGVADGESHDIAVAIGDAPGLKGTEPARTLAELYLAGATIAWEAVHRDRGSRRVPLPTYPFARESHRIESDEGRLRPFAPSTSRTNLPGQRRASPLPDAQFDLSLDTAGLPWLRDHQVFNSVVLPAAFHLAWAGEAAALLSALPVSITGMTFLRPLVLTGEKTRLAQLVVGSGELKRNLGIHALDGDSWTRIAEGAVSQASANRSIDLNEISRRCPNERDGALFLKTHLNNDVVRLGPSFRWLEQLHSGPGETLARLRAASTDDDASGLLAHPGLIDSCLQALGAAAPHAPESASDSVDDGRAWIPVAVDAYEVYRKVRGGAWCHAVLREHTGEALVGDITIADDEGQVCISLTGVRIHRIAMEAFASNRGHDMLLRRVWIELPPVATVPDGAWRVVGDGTELRAAGLALDDAAPTVVDMRGAVSGRDPEAAASELSALAAELSITGAHLAVVTRGAEPLWGRSDAAGASIAAVVEALREEHPTLQARVIDLDPHATEAAQNAALVRELMASTETGEPRVALRAGARYGMRLRPQPNAMAFREPMRVVPTGAAGGGVKLEPFERKAPGRGEVEIGVRAAGLNFRDVMNGLGLLPGGGPLGLECSGIVTRIGPDVHGIAPGDAVMAMAAGSLATHVLAPRAAVLPIPKHLSFREAATVLGAYATAWHGLVTLAALQPGERVLVHAAAGGVGQAAVNIARLRGAHVVATAGSASKRARLEAMGLTPVLDSRGDFSKGVPEVDVVIAAVTGPAAEASLRMLRSGGRYIELAKEQKPPNRSDVSWMSFDLGTLAPERLAALLEEVRAKVASGALPPLPGTEFALSDAGAALAFMSRARHVGKVVLTVPPEAVELRRDGAYVVTGGSGALGLVAADWLRRRGAGEVVLMARHPPASLPEGCRFVTVDLTAEGAVEKIAAAVTRPLRGLVHAAGVAGPDAARVKFKAAAEMLKTFAPDLELAILFSSAAAILPGPGQASYAAANAALDSLCDDATGCRVVSLGWGAWDRGLAKDHRVPDPLTPQLGSAALDAALSADASHVLVLPKGQRRALANRRLLIEAAPTAPPQKSEVKSLRDRLAETPLASRSTVVRDHVRAVVGQALGLDDATVVDPGQPLGDLGLDSLLALELRSTLASSLARPLPSTLLFDHPTIGALTAFIERELLPSSPAPKDLNTLDADEVAALLRAELGSSAASESTR